MSQGVDAPDVPDELVCQWGCYDEEDEACHGGLNQNQCAEIYGHVVWAQACECGVYDSVARPKTGETNIYFSVPVFIVTFRESLEVVIFLSIILQFLNNGKQEGIITDDLYYRFRREVYVGATLGFCVCMVFAVICVAIVYYTSSLFEGDDRLIFEFVMMMATCILLSFMSFQFFKMIISKEAHERKFKKLFNDSVQATQEAEVSGDTAFGRKYAFFVFAFTTGVREGMECVGFLIAVVPEIKDLSSLPLPIILALVAARLIGCCFFQSTKGMKVDKFMKASSIFLLFVCAGFFASSMHNLQELDVFGVWSPRVDRPWQNQMVWDAQECCNDKTNRFFVLMRALLGWQDQATPVELFAWATYWIVSLSVGTVLVRKAKKDMEKRKEEWRRQDEEAERQKAAEEEAGKNSEASNDVAAVVPEPNSNRGAVEAWS